MFLIFLNAKILKMIVKENDRHLRDKEKNKPKPKADDATLAYLEALPWRPFGVEW